MRRFKGYHRLCEVNDGEGFWVYVRVVLMALLEAGFVDFFSVVVEVFWGGVRVLS